MPAVSKQKAQSYIPSILHSISPQYHNKITTISVWHHLTWNGCHDAAIDSALEVNGQTPGPGVAI